MRGRERMGAWPSRCQAKEAAGRRAAGSSGRIAWLGILCAIALALGYAETLIPLPVTIPGVKLGLANIAVLVALWTVDAKGAAAVAGVKVVAVALLFGSLSMLAFSATGTALALVAMIVLRRGGAGVVATSIVAAMAHVLGQLAVAAALLSTGAVLLNAPMLLVAACVTGCLTGGLARAALEGLERYVRAE